MALLSAHDVHKTYRLGRVDVPVLRGVSMSVEQGEWVAILGASGSGKSTLLHLLGGLDRPDKNAGDGVGSGPAGARARIVFAGRDVTAFSGAELDAYRNQTIGFVFQFYHLLPELNVLENVLLAAMIRHGRLGYAGKAPVLRERAEDILRLFGLGARLRHRPSELSGGERQRVAIARALINEPRALLADEPTGNLDHASGAMILDLLAQRRQAQQLTMVMVTHDREVAARADRVVRIVDGRIEEETGTLTARAASERS